MAAPTAAELRALLANLGRGGTMTRVQVGSALLNAAPHLIAALELVEKIRAGDAGLVEVVARSLSQMQNFPPDALKNGQPRWVGYVPVATAALSAIAGALQETEK